MLFKRGLFLLFGLILSYFAVLAGDGMHQYILNAETDFEIIAKIICLIVACIACISGIALWWLIVAEHIMNKEPETDFIFVVTTLNNASIICLSLVYGIIVSPFAEFGPAPWQWWSAWDLFLLLALFPTIYLGFDIGSDAVSAWRRRPKTKQPE